MQMDQKVLRDRDSMSRYQQQYRDDGTLNQLQTTELGHKAVFPDHIVEFITKVGGPAGERVEKFYKYLDSLDTRERERFIGWWQKDDDAYIVYLPQY